MQEIINNLVNNAVNYLQTYGILFGCFIVFLEAIVPVLPLGVFIAFNMIAFGSLVGFVISWISSIVGCICAYGFFYKIHNKKIEERIEKHSNVLKVTNAIKNIKFTYLVLLIALPFTPAFLINVACGLSKMEFKKFIASIMIGKLSIIYFWGFISKSVLQSVTDIRTIISVAILLIITYILSRVINKKLKIG